MNWILIITSIVTAAAVLIYTVFAGLQWWAIRKQAEHTANQVVNMQGQLDEMKRQAGFMKQGLDETRKIVEQNERAVTAAERTAEIAHEGERAYIGITKLAIDTLTVGQSPTLCITWCNAGKTPAWHFLSVPYLMLGDKEPSGDSYCMNRDIRDVEASFVPAGKDVTVSYFISHLKITKETLAEVTSGRQRLFARIHALYVDFQGQRRLFEATAVYEPDTGVFTDCYDDYQGETKPN
jgi:hypothetical protein